MEEKKNKLFVQECQFLFVYIFFYFYFICVLLLPNESTYEKSLPLEKEYFDSTTRDIGILSGEEEDTFQDIDSGRKSPDPISLRYFCIVIYIRSSVKSAQTQNNPHMEVNTIKRKVDFLVINFFSQSWTRMIDFRVGKIKYNTVFFSTIKMQGYLYYLHKCNPKLNFYIKPST